MKIKSLTVQNQLLNVITSSKKLYNMVRSELFSSKELNHYILKVHCYQQLVKISRIF